MRIRTLVLIALVAVSAIIVSLPTSHSQTSANAPLRTASETQIKRSIEISKLATYEASSTKSTKKASRSKERSSLNTNAEANKAYARDYMASQYGWGEDQHSCLVSLWNRESGWRENADNPNSSAYGIPQALPGKKMASAGSDWKTNPHTQIKWGLSYIKGRYDTPCGAWGAFKKKGWY